ncbi:Hypothetical protein CINCED_3A003445 [Cinara cedri]|uniref:Uncharacterized protein n=1 Tax=Cinara cedri TaxID=506608 RepID=A0A5E4N3J3_9HEMI|nr:Hypothetical protein CINCED_3A003445 [Cinara cedri]
MGIAPMATPRDPNRDEYYDTTTGCQRFRHHCRRRRRRRRDRPMSTLAFVAFALYAVATVPPVLLTPASDQMSLLRMQRIKSYVDDTCTLDPHCQWSWDRELKNGLRNVTVDQAASMVPPDYLYPPGNDSETGQRGECSLFDKCNFKK